MNRIAELRKKKGYSQAALGKLLGRAQNTICNWENGNREADNEALLQMSELFEVSVDYLLGHESFNPTAIFLGSTIKKLRKARKWTQAALASYLGIAQNTLSYWEQGKYEPDNHSLIQMSELFNVSVDYLLGKSNVQRPLGKSGVKIPVLGRVVTGIPIEAIEDIIDDEEIPADMASRGTYFALQIYGDSMEPRMKEGDVVIVRQQEDVDSGDLAIVLVNGNDATVKRIRKSTEGIMLIPFNTAYEPIFYTNKQIDELSVRIIGKVVELRAKF